MRALFIAVPKVFFAVALLHVERGAAPARVRRPVPVHVLCVFFRALWAFAVTQHDRIAILAGSRAHAAAPIR